MLDQNLSVFLPEGGPAGDLLPALTGPATILDTGVSADRTELLDGLNLWLAVHEPAWCIFSESPRVRLPPSPLDLRDYAMASGIVSGDSLALLASGPVALATRGHGPRAGHLAARGHGPAADHLAARLTGHVRAWHSAGRPATEDLHIDAYRGPAPPGPPVIEKSHTTLAFSWTGITPAR
jgi:protein-L-isoaspartate(D-aspartate) O-methyltransferase